jgi:hypothetical protein
MPECLRIWFFRNPELLSQLMRTGHACIKDILQTCTGIKKLDIGNIIVLQTAGRPGNYNPHLHILMTAGGLDKKGKWKSVSYIPYDMMHKKWQFHLLNMLRQNVTDPNIEKDIDRAWSDYPNGFVAFLQAGEVPPGGQGLAQYLAELKDMTGNSSATGIGTTRQDKLNTKLSLSCDSSDVWFSTFSQRAFRESDITDCTVTYDTKK